MAVFNANRDPLYSMDAQGNITPKGGYDQSISMPTIDVSTPSNMPTVTPSSNAPSGAIIAPTTKFAEPKFDVSPSANYGDEFPVAPAPNTTAGVLRSQQKEYRDQVGQYNTAMLGISGAAFLLDVMNANNAYSAATGQAQLNIMQTRNQASDALYRGRQAQMDRQSEGRAQGDAALLNAAAQGQDVNGAGTQKIKNSYEALGIYNGMREEINSMREALGYQLEENAYDYQIDMAGIQRNSTILSSALNFGVSGARAYAGVL